MVVQLRILNGRCSGQVFDLNHGGDYFVGQRETAQIRIEDPWISWDHARIFRRNNQIFVEDLNSTNGTFINLQRIQCEALSNEDVVFFGKTHALFVQNELPANGDFQNNLDRAANSDQVWNTDQAMNEIGPPPGNMFSAPTSPIGNDPFAGPDPFLSDSNDIDLFRDSNDVTGSPLDGPPPDPLAARPGMNSFNSGRFVPGPTPGPMPKDVPIDDIEKLLSTSSIDGFDELFHNNQGGFGLASQPGGAPLPPPPPPLGGMNAPNSGPLPDMRAPAPPPPLGGMGGPDMRSPTPPPMFGAPPPSGPQAFPGMSPPAPGNAAFPLPPPAPAGSFPNSNPPGQMPFPAPSVPGIPSVVTPALLPEPGDRPGSGGFGNPGHGQFPFPAPMPAPPPPGSGPLTSPGRSPMDQGLPPPPMNEAFPPRSPTPPPMTPPPMTPPVSQAPSRPATNDFEVSELRRRLAMAQDENQRLKSQAESQASARESQNNNRFQVMLEQARTEIARLNQELSSVKAELSSRTEELDSITEELDAVTDEMIDKEDRIQELEDQLNAVQRR